jgi:hypothetical protein
MFTLGLIVRNPAGAAAITWVGVVILALLAALLAGLWVFVARELVTHDENPGDPALEALRHRKFVVLRSRKARGPQATDVAELEPTGESEPTGS